MKKTYLPSIVLISFVILQGCNSPGYYRFLPGKGQTAKDYGEIGYQDADNYEIVVDLHLEKSILAVHFCLKNNSESQVSIGLIDFIIKEAGSGIAFLTEPDGIYIQRQKNDIDKKPTKEVTVKPKESIEGYIEFKKYPVHPKIIIIVNGKHYVFHFWQLGQ